METETYVFLAVRLSYVPQAQTVESLNLITEISKMLTKLRTRLINL